jgi:putative CocE/NonD family hydrolase
MGVSGVNLPADPIQSKPSFSAALAAFEKLPRVTIPFDNGDYDPNPGAPIPGFFRSFSSFPVPGTEASSWYLGNAGKLKSGNGGGAAGSEGFTWDPSARPRTDFTGNTGSGDLWTATPSYNWTQSPDTNAISYVSSALTKDTAVIGAGALQAWIKSSAPSVDLQVTVSEVRPDDKETYVQSGWLRASERKLDQAKSTQLEPVLSLLKSDAAPLPSGKWAKVTVPLYYEGHMYRAGSRIRVTISATGGDKPVWAFDETQPAGTADVSLAHSKSMPSRLLLPVVPGDDAPTDLPACPSLRGEPCRDYVPFTNDELGAP